MAINPTAAAYITNNPDINAAVVDIDVKGADSDSNRQSGRALVVTVSGTLNADGSYSPGFSGGGGGGGGTIPTGSAGSPNASVVTVQGINGGTPQTTSPLATYNATYPTVTSGATSSLQLGSRGSLRVEIAGANSSIGAAALLPGTDNIASGNGLVVTGQNLRFNGSNWDKDKKPNTVKRVASVPASGGPDVARAGAGDLMTFWGEAAATKVYLQFYNKATAPVIGTDNPVLTFPVPANSVFSQAIPNGGLYFTTGISYAVTTDPSGTTAAAAGSVVSLGILCA